MIKKIKHWVHTSKHKYINGPKGVISIMLAILMLPFFSLAAILVESERYQSAVSMLDSAMGSSSLSVLANYDNYVYNRFGVMSVSQDADIQKLFSQYLAYNTSHTSGSVALSNITAQGKYDIADTRVLKQQLLEYCKLNAPLTLADTTLNLSDLIKKLEGLTNLTGIFSSIKSAGKSVDSIKQIVDDIKVVKDGTTKLDALRTDYDKKFDTFSKSVTNLASALAKPRPEYKASGEQYDAVEAAEVADKAEEYDKNIATLRSAAADAKSAYYQNNLDIASAIDTVRSEMDKVLTDKKNLENNITSTVTSGVSGVSKLSSESLKKKIKDLDKQIADETDPDTKASLESQRDGYSSEKASVDADNATASSVKDGAGIFNNNMNKCFVDYKDENAKKIMKAFQDQANSVSLYDCTSITQNTSSPAAATYKAASLAGFLKGSDVDSAISTLEDSTISGSSVGLLKSLVETVQKFVKTEGIFDPQLSANINTGYYSTSIGGLPTKTNTGTKDYFTTMLTDLSTILSSGADFAKDAVTIKIFSVIDDLVSLFNAICDFIDSLISFFQQLATRIMELVHGNFDSLSLMTYFAYNLPNRTNFSDGSTMTGFGYAGMKHTDYKLNTLGPLGSISAIVNTLKAAYSGGNDYTFCGAELEYIFFGSNSEMVNQVGSFFAVYFLRLALDAAPVSLNSEVQAMAKAPYVGPVLFLLELLGEPFVDTIILVNGETVPAWETESDVYLTPSGLLSLSKKILNFKSKTVTDEIKGMSADMSKAYKTGDIKESKEGGALSQYASGLLEFSYPDYMLAIMMLLGTEDAYVLRLADLIEMESNKSYMEKGKVYNIYKAYTYIDSTADVNFNQLLPIPSLSTNILFQTKRETFRGY